MIDLTTARHGALLGIIFVGSGLRLVPALGSDFPLNDGGLFFAMVEDLRANGLALPRFTEYNHLSIPFAYPPLGFYVTAAVGAVADVPSLDLLVIIPLVVSLATVPVVYLIARDLLGDRRLVLLATALFAITPHSYQWLITGGGITRAPGFLFALLGILFAIRMYRRPNLRDALLVGTAMGLSALSHPQAPVFGAISIGLLLPFLADRRRAALSMLMRSAAAATVIALPWLLSVLLSHGLDPLISASRTGGSVVEGLLLVLASRTSGGYVEVMGVATSIGVVVCLLRRQWVIPVWFVVTLLLAPRSGLTYAALPASLAVAYLVGDLSKVFSQRIHNRVASTGAMAMISFLLGFAVAVDSLASRLAPSSPLFSLTAAQRGPMRAAPALSEPGDRFVIVSGLPWHIDAVSEWFPVLAGRTSVGTVQGYEWLGGDWFARQRERATALLDCAAGLDALCLTDWIRDGGGAEYILTTESDFLAAHGYDCCNALARALVKARVAVEVYRSDAVTILRWLDNPGSGT